MFIIFNKDGSIFSQTQSDFVMQGSNRVNKVFVGFVGNEYSNWACNGVFNLPNGTRFTIPGIPTQEGFEYLGNKYYGWVIELTNDITMYSGNVALTVQTVNQQANVLYTYLTNIIVNQTGLPLDGFWDSSITVAQFNDYMAQLAVKLQANTVSVVVNENELPEIGEKNVLYFIIGETSDTPYQVKMWNGSEYTLLGTINLSSFASKEEQLQFEAEINAQVEQIRGEVINPFVVVDTISQLPSTNQNKLYIVKETNAWYYWNGNTYVFGGDVIPPQIGAIDIKYDDEYTRLEADNVQEAIEKLVDKNGRLESQVSEKLDKNGYSALAHVGLADNVASPDGITQDTNISLSPTGGTASIIDRFAEIKEIKGLTLNVNQAVKNGNFANGTDNWFMQNGTFSVADGVATFTQSDLSVAYSRLTQQLQKTIPVGNKAIVSFEIKHDHSSNIDITYYFQKDGGFVSIEPNKWTTINVIQEPSGETPYLSISTHNVSLASPCNVSVRNVVFIDLTKMFGAGKEPTSVAEFNNLTRNIDIDTYNEGTLLSSRPNTLISTGFNAFDGELELGSFDSETGLPSPDNYGIRSKNFIPIICGAKYTLTNNVHDGIYVYEYDKHQDFIKRQRAFQFTAEFEISANTYYVKISVYRKVNTPLTGEEQICFHLTHSGYRNEQFEPYVKNIFKLPEGVLSEPLRSAGEAYDSWLKGQIIKRIGEVDLGTPNWQYAGANIFYASLSNVKSTDDYTKANISCPIYTTVRRADLTNGTICISGTDVIIQDTSCPDIPSLLAKINGKPVYYELAEPIITEYTDEESWDIPVSDFGTLQAFSAGSRNLQIGRYVIFYMTNLRDKLRNLPDIPKCEDTTGTSVLKCINGTYIWVKEE